MTTPESAIHERKVIQLLTQPLPECAHRALARCPQLGFQLGKDLLNAAQSERIRAHLQAKPDNTLQELRDGLGLSVALSTLWYHLRRLGLTFKKNADGG